jgi:hypothetical protein
MKIYSVTSVSVIKVSEEPLTLHIQAYGRVSSTGWTNVRLEAATVAKGDTVLDFTFEADAPTGITAPVILPVTAAHNLHSKTAVDAIIVTSRTNSITVHASEFLTHSAAAALAQPALQGVHPATPLYGAGHVPSNPITTFIVGEEGPTWLIAENHPTNIFVEHHPTYIGIEHSAPFIAAENISLLNPAEGLLNPVVPVGPNPGPVQGGPAGSF